MFKTQFFIIFALILIAIAQKPKCPAIQINDLCRVPARDQSKLTTTGSVPPEGYYPWYAAIYHNKPDKMLFRCAGSIISENVILTARECFREIYKDLANNQLLVQVGSNKKYLGGTFFNVLFKTKSNLGVIVLEKSIKFTNFIRPICIEPNNINDVLQSQQWVTGWDKKSKVGSELVHQELEPSEKNQDCNANKNIYNDCRSDSQGITNCLANSGAGLAYQVNGQWSLRGVASTIISAEKDKNFTICNDHVWFEDVNTNYDWLKNVLQSVKERNLCHAHVQDNANNGTTEQQVPAGYYPWHVSLFEDGVNRCGASIISSSLIITAASCFITNRSEIPNEKLSVQLSDTSVYKVLSKTYSLINRKDFNAWLHNIGIVQLREQIRFSVAIRPICLSSIPFEDYPKTDQWGVGTSQTKALLNHQTVELSKGNENCLSYLSSNCDAPVTGSTNCVSDYGSGVVFKVGKQWFLRGIALILKNTDPNESNCDKMMWMIEIRQNYDWIQSEIKRLS